MPDAKFDPAKLEKLNDLGRFDTLIPEVMWDALGEPGPGVVVDIGAGTGLFASKFAEFAPQATVYAVDSEPVMIDWMRDNRTETQSGRLVPVLSTECCIPLQDELADLALMVSLHHELEEPERIYAEALRILRPGGQLLVVDWAPIETPKGPPLEFRIAAEEAADLIGSIGFGDVTVHEGLPWHWLITGRRP